MIKLFTYRYIVTFLLFLFTQPLFSQTCGFGCLGLSGVYAGYSFENYNADGLNSYLNEMLYIEGTSSNKFDFNKGTGFRFGMNIVRAQYDTYFFTVKGYYQFLSEEQTIVNPVSSLIESEYKSKFEMNHWAIGFDFGIPVFKFLDWKIVDGSIKFFDTKLNNQIIEGGNVVWETNYEIPKVTVGFAVGSGLVIHIVEDYVSLEGVGMYNFTTINNLAQTDGSGKIPNSDSNSKLISEGGLSATIQLNIGIPLQ